jgi:hypothetical protein
MMDMYPCIFSKVHRLSQEMCLDMVLASALVYVGVYRYIGDMF